MSDHETLAAAWISLADRDFAMARRMFPDFTEGVVYHCQQAAEKAIKGLLTFQQLRIEKTHDIPKLLSIAARETAEVDELKLGAERLTDWAFESRYPDDGLVRIPEEDAAQLALEYASALLAFVKSRIPPPQDAEED